VLVMSYPILPLTPIHGRLQHTSCWLCLAKRAFVHPPVHVQTQKA
jgi:hypothetical protein